MKYLVIVIKENERFSYWNEIEIESPVEFKIGEIIDLSVGLFEVQRVVRVFNKDNTYHFTSYHCKEVYDL